VVRQFDEADRSALVTAIAVHDAGAALASDQPVSSLAEFTLPVDAFLTPILEEAAELLAKPPSRRQPRKGETTKASADEPNIADPTEPDATAHPAELPLLRSIHAIAATPASGTPESEASCRARVAELLSEVARTLGAFASSANAAASRSTQLRSAIELLGTAIKMGNDARAQGARGDDANDGIATGSNAVEWFPLKEAMRIALDVTREIRPGMVLYAGGSAREEHRSLVRGLRQISGARGSVADIALRLALEGIFDPRGADEIGRHPTPLTEEISRMSAEDFALLTRRDGATNFASEFGRQIIAHQILYHGDRIASLMPQLAPTVPDARPWLEVLEFAAEHRSTSRSIMELDLLRMSPQSLQRLPPTARSSYLLARVERLGTVARSWELDSPRQNDYVRTERVLDEHTLIAIKHAVDEFPFETIAAELPLPIIACVMSHAQFSQLALRDEEVIRLFRYMGPRAQVLWSHAWKRLAPEYRGTASRDTAAGSMSSSPTARDGHDETHTRRTISKDRLAEPIPAHEKAFLSVIAASAMNIGDLVRLANAKLGPPASDHIHNLAGVILQSDRIARALAIKIENAQDAELLVEVGGARVVSHLSEQQLLKLIFGCQKFSWPRKPRLEFFTQPELKPALAAIARQVAEMKHPDPSPEDDDGDDDGDGDEEGNQPASAWSRKLSIPSFGAGDDDEDDDTDRGPAGAARLMLKVLAAPDSRSPRGLGGIDSKTIAKLVELAAKDHPGTSRKHARTAYAAAKQWKVDPADPATRNGSTAPDAIDKAIDKAIDIAVELGEAGLGDEFTHLVDIIEASSLDDRYKTHVIPKKRGGVREIHEPDEDLKRLQRKVLDRLLGGVPISPDAHGFVVDRGIVTNAEAHCGSEVVLNVDIRSFFPSLPAEQIRRALSESRYGRLSSAAIDTLFKIVTRGGRLPQGAPTSPAITNIALRHTDGMLAKACKKAGISYTRYADDLTFSGDSGPVQKIVPLVIELLARIGLELHPEKTQVYRHGRRQLVTGLVVNHWPNLPRRDRRTLRAAAHRSRRGLTMRWKGARMSKESFEGRLAVLKMVDPDLAERLKATADNEDIPPRKKAPTSQKATTRKKATTCKKATTGKKAAKSKKATGTKKATRSKKALGTKKPRGKDSK
jgi:hypothetical protein